MATSTQTDFGVGFGLLFSLLAVGSAVAMTVLGYLYAINHAMGEASQSTQTGAAAAFAVAMLAAGLAVTAVHVYGN
jgi:hypothetical protein